MPSVLGRSGCWEYSQTLPNYYRFISEFLLGIHWIIVLDVDHRTEIAHTNRVPVALGHEFLIDPHRGRYRLRLTESLDHTFPSAPAHLQPLLLVAN